MKKLVVEIMRNDIDKLIHGLETFATEFDNSENNNGFIDLQFIQSVDYVIVLTLDKRGQIIK